MVRIRQRKAHAESKNAGLAADADILPRGHDASDRLWHTAPAKADAACVPSNGPAAAGRSHSASSVQAHHSQEPGHRDLTATLTHLFSRALR